MVENSIKAEQDIEKQAKKNLKEKYTSRLQQKLSYRQPVNLELVSSKKGTSKERRDAFIALTEEDLKKEISSIYQKSNGRLLIVGEPGTGKTTLLLQLAQSLIESEIGYIPVILNIATWKSSFITLENWLLEILPSELGANKAMAKKLLKSTSSLILLLDGFDEINKYDRSSCLDALNKYGSASEHRFVLTSRVDEYKQVSNDPLVYAQLEVKGLTLEQIKEDLEKRSFKQPEAKVLLNAIQYKKSFQKIVSIPFYFNILQLLFSEGIKLSDIELSGNKIEHHKFQIINFYVSNFLSHQTDRNYISYFAYKLKGFSWVSFELVNLQYDWLVCRKLRRFVSFFLDSIIVGIINSISLGILGGIFLGIFSGVFRGVLNGILGGIIIGVLRGVLNGVLNGVLLSLRKLPHINVKDNVRANSLLKNIKDNILFGILGGIILCGIIGSIINRIFLGIISGVLCGFFSGFFSGIINNIANENSSLIQINKPYDRFKYSAYVLWFSIIQHFHLRYLLYKDGVLPFKLVTFLNKMVNQNIMEYNNGTWRFKHKILQDYLADEYEREQLAKNAT